MTQQSSEFLKVNGDVIRFIFDNKRSNLGWDAKTSSFSGFSSDLMLQVAFRVGAEVEVENATKNPQGTEGNSVITFQCVAVKRDAEYEIQSYEFRATKGNKKYCSLTIFND